MSTRTLRRTRQSSSSQQQQDGTEKENTSKQNDLKQEPKARAKPASKARKLYCTCRQPDDGSPMILCSECKEWYHFKCLDLDERDAEEIQIFVCSSCHEKTGLVTVMDWEGPDALESRSVTQTTAPTPIKETTSPEPIKKPSKTPESSDDGSADEYVAEDTKPTLKSRRGHPTPSESDSESDGHPKRKTTIRHLRRPSAVTVTTRMRAVSSSPGPATPLKRRQSTASAQPDAKRKRSESAVGGAGPDAARKYCLTKLQELFRDIFLRYPALGEPAADEDRADEKKPEELSAEEKEQIGAMANQFSAELEECMFELYGEPDVKTGKHGVGAKYKERFRMITFNLSKPDRVVLHKRIASSRISPRELSTMSSTDLADEETKQSIKQAEQEALEQTILQKAMMPTGKMTHKGMQDIEDVTGGARFEQERREREREEEERIERERRERLKLQAQKAARGSAPPDSPVTPMTPSASWGAPPPVPAHALHPHDPSASPTLGRPPVNPLFHQTFSEMAHTPVEHELNLDDLINIDEEPGQEVSISLATPSVPPISGSAATSIDVQGSPDPSASASSTPGPLSISATGISPFASKSAHSDLVPRPSFDLNAIWSPNGEAAPGAEVPTTEEPRPKARPTGSPMGVDIVPDEAEDQDFDMFLNGVDDEPESIESPAPQEPVQDTFDSQPFVWKGKISMPLDSTIPQEVDVKAQLVGGRKLEADSLLWKTLFPLDHLRIDGRVPIDKSAQYLTQTRLNPTRELIAVAFSPESDSSAANFELLSRFLLDKGRHGLIFPWGHRPKEHHPGRELYIVPLMSSEPLPDFIELLDELQLPKLRTANYMIGIWVLTKGKLAPPPATALPPTPVPPTPTPTLPPASATPPIPPILPPPAQATPPMSMSIPPVLPTQPTAPTPAPSTALAAGVAALTPEQIQLMLRTLSANNSVAIPPAPPHAPPPPQMPPQMPPHATPPPPWTGMPPFAPPYPPAPQAHALPPYVPPPYEQAPPPYGYAPQGPPPPPPPHGGRPYEPFEHGPERGGHRGRGGRNRGRGQAQGSQQLGDRPRDAGWGGRGRGRGRGGASPDRGRWGGSPQRWG